MSDGKFRPIACVLALFFVQNFFYLLWPESAPALVLIAVIYFALRNGALSGAWVGAFAGFLAELYGQGRLGFYIASWAAAGYLAGTASRQIFQDSLVAEVLFPGAALYFLSLAELLYRQLGQGGGFPWWGLVEAFHPAALATTVLASLFLFSWLRKVSSRRRPPRPVYR